MHNRGLRDYEVITLVASGALGFAWTLLAVWIVAAWQPPIPTLDPAGIARGILLWPAWLALVVGFWMYQQGWDTLWAWGSATVLSLLLGAALVLYLRRNS